VTATGFQGRTVLSLESRRSAELATIISRLGGTPFVAPSMRELPLASESAAMAFVDALVAGRYDAVVLLTGVGTRALLDVAAERGLRDAFIAALAARRVVARGPKPLAVLREIGVTPWIVAPEPNTWREILSAIDARGADAIHGARVAVQEYGVSNPELLSALRARGASVTTVPIYQWALPEDIGPLQRAVDALVSGQIDVVILTSGVQLAHLWEVARGMGKDALVKDALARVFLASIGPTCSEEIRRRGLEPTLEASHPKMGILVTEAARRL
jgi:uroporphyrinogen-III synthase